MKVSPLQYAKTLYELTQNKSESEISEIVKRFVLQLGKDGQVKNASKIMKAFADIYNKENGIVEVGVTSQRALTAEQIAQVESFVKEKYNAKVVEVHNVIDEKIKGGIIIRVGDEVMDGSLNKQLNNLKKILYS